MYYYTYAKRTTIIANRRKFAIKDGRYIQGHIMDRGVYAAINTSGNCCWFADGN